MDSDTVRSEFESVVLGLLASGHQSGYAMRKELMRMRGHRWSVDSGSVYRALRRMERDGLVRVVQRSSASERERTDYALTEAGQASVDQWLRGGLGSDILEECADPIRTRTYFLSLLDPGQRLSVAQTWLKENRQWVMALRRDLKENAAADPLHEIAFRSFVVQAEARQEWLRRLVAYLQPIT